MVRYIGKTRAGASSGVNSKAGKMIIVPMRKGGSYSSLSLGYQATRVYNYNKNNKNNKNNKPPSLGKPEGATNYSYSINLNSLDSNGYLNTGSDVIYQGNSMGSYNSNGFLYFTISSNSSPTGTVQYTVNNPERQGGIICYYNL